MRPRRSISFAGCQRRRRKSKDCLQSWVSRSVDFVWFWLGWSFDSIHITHAHTLAHLFLFPTFLLIYCIFVNCQFLIWEMAKSVTYTVR
jgi:hypothetical protein